MLTPHHTLCKAAVDFTIVRHRRYHVGSHGGGIATIMHGGVINHPLGVGDGVARRTLRVMNHNATIYILTNMPQQSIHITPYCIPPHVLPEIHVDGHRHIAVHRAGCHFLGSQRHSNYCAKDAQYARKKRRAFHKEGGLMVKLRVRYTRAHSARSYVRHSATLPGACPAFCLPYQGKRRDKCVYSEIQSLSACMQVLFLVGCSY